METTLERPKAIFSAKKAETISTYSLIMSKIENQKRLIDAGIIEKPKPINGFSAQDWQDFYGGISIEEYAFKRGIVL
ncbi:hypothetical protein FACS189434_00930 [Bacteroidia bacterium]|nr:hypothetical protein FACS189434_00930 [Bacteroidia bacterium]